MPKLSERLPSTWPIASVTVASHGDWNDAVRAWSKRFKNDAASCEGPLTSIQLELGASAGRGFVAMASQLEQCGCPSSFAELAWAEARHVSTQWEKIGWIPLKLSSDKSAYGLKVTEDMRVSALIDKLDALGTDSAIRVVE